MYKPIVQFPSDQRGFIFRGILRLQASHDPYFSCSFTFQPCSKIVEIQLASEEARERELPSSVQRLVNEICKARGEAFGGLHYRRVSLLESNLLIRSSQWEKLSKENERL